MKKIIIPAFLFAALSCMNAAAQPGLSSHETAKTFMRQGDYANAVIVLNKALQQDPQNMAMAKDLALTYTYKKDPISALTVIKPLLERDDADDQCFQIAGNIYRQLDNAKECEKMYKKGLKRFPNSGPLYNELGELQFETKNYEAIKNWEKGIEEDPGYSKNYFNAARYYFLTKDKARSLLYGEIFVNMEPNGSKTPEIKQILLDSYKKFFTDPNPENTKEKSALIKKYITVLGNQSQLAANGINTGSLEMIRSRFILDWFAGNNNKIPFRLFEYQQQLLKEGIFEAYNQWLFGATQNTVAYQNWVNTHSTENNSFLQLQQSRIFKVPAGQGLK